MVKLGGQIRPSRRPGQHRRMLARHVVKCSQVCGQMRSRMRSNPVKYAVKCGQICGQMQLSMWSNAVRYVVKCIQVCGQMRSGMWSSAVTYVVKSDLDRARAAKPRCPRLRRGSCLIRVASCPSQLKGPVRVTGPSPAPGKGSEPAMALSQGVSQAEDPAGRRPRARVSTPRGGGMHGPGRVTAVACVCVSV